MMSSMKPLTPPQRTLAKRLLAGWTLTAERANPYDWKYRTQSPDLSEELDVEIGVIDALVRSGCLLHGPIEGNLSAYASYVLTPMMAALEESLKTKKEPDQQMRWVP